jgi:pyruvate dehydrogenase E2 component (dihydrolipoamide acetyltransferase)
VDEVEMDQLVALRSELKDHAAQADAKLSYLPFIVKAVVSALKKFPVLNASVDDEAGEIVYKHDYNIGIATATEAGLTVPVLKGADKKSILEAAIEIAALSDRARNRKSTLADLSDGTFTITSLGRIGGLMATPIINHPEVGILGIHNLQDRAVVRNGQIVIRKMMNISVSFDHRVVDGDVGAAFAQEVKGYLEQPGRLLLQMA